MLSKGRRLSVGYFFLFSLCCMSLRCITVKIIFHPQIKVCALKLVRRFLLMARIFSQEMREEQESVLTDHRMIERDKFIIYSAGYFTNKGVRLYKGLVRICLGILFLSLVAQDQAM